VRTFGAPALEPEHPRPLVNGHAVCECGASKRPREPRRLHRCAVTKEDAASEARRADPLRHLLGGERHGLLGDAELPCRRDRPLDRRVLERSGGHLQVAALAQPDVRAVAFAELAHGRHGTRGRAGDLESPVVAEDRPKAREVCPVPVQESAVAAARAPSADLRLEHGDRRGRLARLQGERGQSPV
jgi:hypothetical protein